MARAPAGVDAGFLASGVSVDEQAMAEALLARAESLAEEHRFDEAIDEYQRALPLVVGTGALELHVRVSERRGAGARARAAT